MLIKSFVSFVLISVKEHTDLLFSSGTRKRVVEAKTQRKGGGKTKIREERRKNTN